MSGVSLPRNIEQRSERTEEFGGGTMLRPSGSTSSCSLSKGLSSTPALHFLDANSFADALGISPAFRQQETLRWNSALELYKQMSSHDLTSLTDNIYSENDENSGIIVNINTNANADSEPSNFGRSSLPPGRPGKYGFSTPQTSILGLPEAKRSGSYVSPGESSLNSLELEAIAAVHELQFAVKDIFVSELLPRTSELIFLNVTTLEGQAYCVELTMKGWRVTSLRHDCMNGDFKFIQLHTKYFETIYALMDNISPSYRRMFSEALSAKLDLLQKSRSAEEGASSHSSSLRNDADRILNCLAEDSAPITVNIKASSEEPAFSL